VKHLLYKAQKKPISNEVLFINTPSSIMSHPRDDYLSYDHNMPLGLICLASYLENEGYPIKILDSYAENLGVLSTIDRIFAGETIPEIIGLNSSSPNIHIVRDICNPSSFVTQGCRDEDRVQEPCAYRSRDRERRFLKKFDKIIIIMIDVQTKAFFTLFLFFFSL
jgi:hypothetical protein